MFIFAWKDIDTFRRHIEEMESFHRAHKHLAPVKPAGHSRNVQKPIDGNPPCPAQPVNGFTSANGKKIVVPIWYISMPKGSQN
jgi:hypothetical protein